MSEKDEQIAENAGTASQPPQHVWAITSDPKVAEYKEQINATGVRFQRIAGAVIGFLLLLLFGFILPAASSRTVAYVSELRSRQSQLEQKIKRGEVKTELREETSDLWKVAVPTQTPKRALDTERGKNHQKVAPDQTAERPAENKGAANRRQLTHINDALQRSEEGVRDLDFEKSPEERLNALKTLKESVGTEVEKLQDLEGEEGIEAKAYRATRARATALQDAVDLALLKLRREALSSRKVPLDILGVFGISIQGLADAKLPVLYLPILWSVLLFGFLLFRATSRLSMLNLYARFVRRALAVNEGVTPAVDNLKAFLDAHAEELLGVPKCGWWWLAPLPWLDGIYLRGHEFRAALGWTKAHGGKICLVAIAACVLILLQIVVLVSGITINDLFEDESLRWIFQAIEWAIALANGLLILLALLPLDRVPDFGTNQEEGVQLDRRALLRLALASIVLAPFAYKIWGRQFAAVARPGGHGPCTPRFRARKPIRWRSVEGFTQGFFENLRSYVVHYLALKVPISSSSARQRQKRRRTPFYTRAERTRYRARVAAWRRSGAGLEARPRRQRDGESPKNREQTCPPTPRGKAPAMRLQHNVPDDVLVFRDADHLSLAHLKPLSPDQVLKELQNASTVHSQSKRTSAQRSSSPRLYSKRFVFAVEQEVLRVLHESPTKIEYACEFLLAAIETRGPSLDTLRLFDLLAALSFRHQKEDFFKKVQRKADEYGRTGPRFVEFSIRAERWGNRSGKWQQRWAPKTTTPEKQNRDKWASLPM